ncbi:expansin-like A3 [Cucurbita pepo subsp. pepo]|uniref:expansin-like A3 n=1 Tax=Cucurbita pepo subsp. pepo TaxID=3664 RepID=UPI000C9D621C|nr:expansin-like A3 [Cucurbita pepo subsp. pepo]
MAFYVGLLFFLVSSAAAACDRCVHQSKSAYYYDDTPIQHGACGYGPLAFELSNGYVAGVVPSLYRQGAGCGACFQVRCKNKRFCSTAGTKVVATDQNYDNRYDFVLSKKAYSAMALKNKTKELLNLGTIDVEYKRIPCTYKNKNLMVRVEEWSQKPYYLALKLVYQGGQTEIKGIEIAEVGSDNWESMKRNYGAIWDTNKVLEGALQLKIVVASRYNNENIYWATYDLPDDWKNGEMYDTGVQIDDIVNQKCPPKQCGDLPWK